ncbi:MAG: matrixin family metalloprotease [Kineosporiaceae bacterium]
MSGTGGGILRARTRWWALAVATGFAVGAVTLPSAAARWARAEAGIPASGHEAAGQPLGSPPVVAFPKDTFRFIQHQDDGTTPVTWDPCRPVHYVVQRAGVPAGGEALLAVAVQEISAATGLQFVADGPTDETPDWHRPRYQPERYGDRWAPVLISWRTAAETPEFAHDAVGLTNTQPVAPPGRPWVFVTGQIQLDATAFTRLLSRPEGTELARAVIEHELGHLVGLDHVDVPTEIMYPQANLVITELGPGDRTGLARLGQGPCVPEL